MNDNLRIVRAVSLFVIWFLCASCNFEDRFLIVKDDRYSIPEYRVKSIQSKDTTPSNMSHHDFDKLIFNQYHEGIKKFNFIEIGFDRECIYSIEDFQEFVTDILDAVNLEYIPLAKGKSEDSRFYFFTISIKNKAFTFKTETQTDWVNLIKIKEVLDTISDFIGDQKVFREPTHLGANAGALIYGLESEILQARAEGLPCCVSQYNFNARSNILLDRSQVSINVQLKEIPLFEQIKSNYLEALRDLNNQGYLVPVYQEKQLYLVDFFDEGNLWICVNGQESTENKIQEKTVDCVIDTYGLVLAYLLTKDFSGIPSVVYRKGGQKVDMEPKEFCDWVLKNIKREN